MPGIIGKSAGNAMISAGTLSLLAKYIPKTPIKNEASKVATEMLKISVCIIKYLLECAIAASSAEKASVLFGGELAYAKPNPATAANAASTIVEKNSSNI